MRDRRRGSTLRKGLGARQWQAVSRRTKRRWASARQPFSGLALVPGVPVPPSSYPTNRSAVDPCTSSKFRRCGTSRTVLKRPFRQLAGELNTHCQYGFIGRSGCSRTNVLFFPPVQKKKPLTCDSHAFARITSLTRVLILELGNIIDIFVDDDPGTVALAMRRDVLLAKCLCHGGDGSGGEG